MGAGLIVAGAAMGAAGGLWANKQRRGQARRQRKYLKQQQELLNKQRDNNKSLVRLQATGQAIQNTASSRSDAANAFQGESAAEAALGVSGLSGGTPFYSLASKVAQDRTVLAEGNAMGRIAMDTLQAGAKAKSLDFDAAQLSIKQSRNEIDRELDYLNSPLSSILTVATGGMSGARLGADLSMIQEKYFGPEQAEPKPVISSSGGVPVDTGIIGSDQLPQLTQLGSDAIWSNNAMEQHSALRLLTYGA